MFPSTTLSDFGLAREPPLHLGCLHVPDEKCRHPPSNLVQIYASFESLVDKRRLFSSPEDVGDPVFYYTPASLPIPLISPPISEVASRLCLMVSARRTPHLLDLRLFILPHPLFRQCIPCVFLPLSASTSIGQPVPGCGRFPSFPRFSEPYRQAFFLANSSSKVSLPALFDSPLLRYPWCPPGSVFDPWLAVTIPGPGLLSVWPRLSAPFANVGPLLQSTFFRRLPGPFSFPFPPVWICFCVEALFRQTPGVVPLSRGRSYYSFVNAIYPGLVYGARLPDSHFLLILPFPR